MKDYRKSNYAINKLRKGIVYRNADGSILEITFEKIAANNPNFTKEDFEKLKELSDELYHEEEKSDNLQAHYVKVSLDETSSDEWLAGENLEDEFFGQQDTEAYIKDFQSSIDMLLTPLQKKRLFMNCFKGMTVREIAKSEGVHYTVIAESIRAAKKKLKKLK